MGPTDRVAERLRTLDASAFVAFCAALWDARGYETRVTDGRVVATRDGDRVELLVRTPPTVVRRVAERVRTRLGTRRATRRRVEDPADVVVTSTDGPWATRLAERHGARHLGPADVADCLLYGVSRADAADIASQWLDTDVSTLLASAQSPAAAESRVGLTTVAAVGGVVCLVVAAAVLWAPAGVSGGAGPPSLTDAEAATSASQSDSVTTDAAETPSAGDGDGSAYPPGVTADGVDVRTLSQTHARLADNRSYRLVLRHSGTETLDDSRRWDGAWQHAVVEDRHTWLYSVVGYAAAENGSELVQYTVYADGKFAYRRLDDGANTSYDRYPVRITASDGYGRHSDRVRRSLLRYLTTTDVAVDQPSWNPDAYRIVASGRPTYVEANVSNYTATALVTPAGFVTELTVEYDHPDAGQVRFRFEYAAVDRTQVRPPGWYDEARLATAANATRD